MSRRSGNPLTKMLGLVHGVHEGSKHLLLRRPGPGRGLLGYIGGVVIIGSERLLPGSFGRAWPLESRKLSMYQISIRSFAADKPKSYHSVRPEGWIIQSAHCRDPVLVTLHQDVLVAVLSSGIPSLSINGT